MQLGWAQLLALFGEIEHAIEGHERLSQVAGVRGEPQLVLSRFGATVRVMVRATGSRSRRPTVIHGDGDTPQGAVADLIQGLDHWAAALG